MNFNLEVIGFTIEGCILAQSAGASRIELCDNPADGGTTPSYGFIKAAREKLNIHLFPIIRPRGGDCKQLGCDGVVIGILNADGTVDIKRNATLVELAYPLGVTFHRAFDRTADAYKAMEDIIGIGCERILTSGQKPNALDGAGLISELIKQADDRILIMPGSGVRPDNIIDLAQKTGATEFHTSARVNVDSRMSFTNPAMNETLQSVSVDEAAVKKMAELLSAL
jgi:copper homeostasis protein